MENNLNQRMCDFIRDQIIKSTFIPQMKGSEKTNYINNVGKKFGFEQISSENPETYHYAMNTLNDAIKERSMPKRVTEKVNIDIDKILNEVTLELPQSKNIVRYDEDIVTKTIRDILDKDMKNTHLEKIKGDDGGAFFNILVSIYMEGDMFDDMERKRFFIAQVMANFRSEFFAKISMILPVININTSSYQFTKNSNKLTFEATICLSHTNDRDWVSGVRKNQDTKKRLEIDREWAFAEASVSKKHTVKPIPLQSAVVAYKNGQINMKMFETAIKACGRSELETFVLNHVGITPHVSKDPITAENDGEDEQED